MKETLILTFMVVTLPVMVVIAIAFGLIEIYKIIDENI